ncbi:PRC-barrel domain-containing protein [Halomonas daqiaonensis]|uniref:PRC-barrel domain-containing protein n=1 Tax=Halomonas daqiaonensis TaxID=650850 RepID=A0A1H7RS85_9GAMM|nr:PRC-barrel domain-containing protein [Halomonas daqiaonensis]SEL63082.1 PRC-barrel domain-containing protein [Halomonas daqiaonensis]
MKPHSNTVSFLSFSILPIAMLAAQAAQGQGDTRSLDEWSYEPLYQAGGIRAEKLLNAKAIGTNDNVVGTIENVILDQENQIVTLIAEVGDMWGSASRHVSIPWEEAELVQEGVRVPVHEDNVEDYNLFDDEYVDDSYIFKGDMGQTTQVEGNVLTGPRIWKITDVIDDFASLGNDTGMGYIEDILLTRDGVIQAIVVKPSSPEFGNGPQAYPFLGGSDDWQPNALHYELPYSGESVSDLPAFDYGEYDNLWSD